MRATRDEAMILPCSVMMSPPVAFTVTRLPAIGMVFNKARVFACSDAQTLGEMEAKLCFATAALAATRLDLAPAERADAAPRIANVRTPADLETRMAGAASPMRDSTDARIWSM